MSHALTAAGGEWIGHFWLMGGLSGGLRSCVLEGWLSKADSCGQCIGQRLPLRQLDEWVGVTPTWLGGEDWV